jgi:hypothetical protein
LPERERGNQKLTIRQIRRYKKGQITTMKQRQTVIDDYEDRSEEFASKIKRAKNSNKGIVSYIVKNVSSIKPVLPVIFDKKEIITQTHKKEASTWFKKYICNIWRKRIIKKSAGGTNIG